MANTYFAVIDVGKTNKKVLIYDQQLRVVDSAYESFNEFEQDGIILEDLENMTAWIKDQLRLFGADYRIRVLSVTAHGAFAVGLDKNGKLAMPPVAYTNQAGDEFREDFFNTFGDPVVLKKETGTAEIGSMVNIGKLVYFWKKTWPEKWPDLHSILYMPQYFGYLFTGKAGAEPTYIGCHTYLYNPKTGAYSSVADKLGVRDMMPSEIKNSWEILGTISPDFQAESGLPADCIVTMGIHDSNASLLPYLVKGFENFVLNSTGTWCVAMHPTTTTEFSDEELEALVFYNIDAFNNPVKTSIFKGGTEFDTYRTILEKIHGEKQDPEFAPELFADIIRNRELFILPSIDKGMGIFPNSEPGVVDRREMIDLEKIIEGQVIPTFFNDFDTAMAVLNISLAIQTFYALNMAGFDGTGTVFIEGGFRKNLAYLNLLGALYPEAKIALTKMEEATSFGAAILARAAFTGSTPKSTASDFEIEITPISSWPLPSLKGYISEFDRLTRG